MNAMQKNTDAFVQLGAFMAQFGTEVPVRNESVAHNDLFYEAFKKQLQLAETHNGWFTPSNLAFALDQWGAALRRENLLDWLSAYPLEKATPQRIAVIMAGNIPLVGFHDFMSVLLCGHSVIVKQSSNDRHLLPFLAKYLEHVNPGFRGKIRFTEDRIEDYDAVIATGSNNTARYFEYYFGKKPHIIRKNRNSVAVLNGSETPDRLEALGEDIFRYFGLGCRNVSKLFVPEHYDFDILFRAVYPYKDIIEIQKYANNYDYNKAVYLMSLFKLQDNGFLMLKEDESYASPIATLFYETYSDPRGLQEKLREDAEHIQCIVAEGFPDSGIPFGHTQKPGLKDYADEVDTVDFLLKI
ncbi:acyl-CoA reductase [Sinomicrobium soli]|uniref:acyl-CoA reductase n=1 Tax=Sinomicrobium sp. N-1-3-6 TaxID=2219864 RepID=UPI000DCC2CF9|nr:acyl-CoA reductase [Sinomicrobium sp. N-1-3-6]RAV29970.1 acyl-CoA reductase [Sinomicrobium sp. N-1-3-6]